MKKILKYLKKNELNVSMVLGLVVVMVALLALTNYFRSVNRRPQISAAKTETAVTASASEGKYEVEPGDSLWTVAQKTYGDGYQWTRIYAANEEAIGQNPGRIMAGMALLMPTREPKPEMVEYETQRGDYLWKIAQDLCQDGYQWSQIAMDNGIRNPNLIYPGQKLKIGCV